MSYVLFFVPERFLNKVFHCIFLQNAFHDGVIQIIQKLVFHTILFGYPQITLENIFMFFAAFLKTMYSMYLTGMNN